MKTWPLLLILAAGCGGSTPADSGMESADTSVDTAEPSVDTASHDPGDSGTESPVDTDTTEDPTDTGTNIGTGTGTGTVDTATVDTGGSYTSPYANPAERAELAASRNTWNATSASHGDSYTWWTDRVDYGATRHVTTQVVVAGVVTERSYVASAAYAYDTAGPEVWESWTETGADLGTHPDGSHHSQTVQVWTLDDAYDYCEQVVLSHDPAHADVDLVIDADGLLQRCTWFPHNCADGCSSGVWVDGLTWHDAP